MKPLLRPVMPELNSLRGLACLWVLLFHGLWWYLPQNSKGLGKALLRLTQDGYRGVSLFFVLSGLLITGILLDSRDRQDYFRRFYKRRALRILPAYYMILIALAMYEVPRSFLVLSFLYISNMAPALGFPMAYGPLWSLAVEEQFYVLWPFFVRKFRKGVLIVVASGLFLNSFILAFQLHTTTPATTYPIWYAAHGLALGSLLAIFLRSRFGKRRNVKHAAGFLVGYGGALLLFLRLEPISAAESAMTGFAWDLIFAGLLLGALLVGTSRLEAWARPRILLFLGEISYGLYLVHVLVFMTYRRVFNPGSDLRAVLLQFAICSAIAIGLATLSRYTVEEWFLELKDRPPGRQSLQPEVSPAFLPHTIDP